MPVTVILSKTISAPLSRSADGFNVAVLLRDFRAETFQAFDVQIDRPRADGAPAGQRDAGASAAGHQRPQDERGGAHRLDQFIRGLGSGESARADRGAVMGASVAEFDFGAHGGQQLARGLDVAHLRDVFENDRLIGEQGSRHARQCGILRAADADCAEQRIATADHELIHTDASRNR